MTKEVASFGDPGRIQKALDDGRCPKCLVALPETDPQADKHCSACGLTISAIRCSSEDNIS